MVRKLGSHFRNQWMGALALFLVLAGGTAYAAATIGSAEVIDESLRSVDIKNGQVAAADLAANSVNTGKVVDNSLKGADIDESTLTGLAPPEAWHPVAPGSATVDRCLDPSATAIFCTETETSETWTNYGNGFSTVAFYKDRLGVVHLKGLAHFPRGAAGSIARTHPIFRLPTAYRPTARKVFPSVGSEFTKGGEVAQGRVDVQPNGLVGLVQDCGQDQGLVDCSATGGDVTLEGIAFRRDG